MPNEPTPRHSAATVPRWKPPLLDPPRAGSDTEPCLEEAPSDVDRLAQRIVELELELGSLRGDLARAREAAAAEGRAAGYDEGRRAGRAAADDAAAAERAAWASQWQLLSAAVEQRLAAFDAEFERAVQDFVIEFAAAVLRVQLTRDGGPLARLLEEITTELRAELASAVVECHPDDIAWLSGAPFDVRGNASIARGDLRLRLAGGDIEASLLDRIDAAVAQLRTLPGKVATVSEGTSA